MRYIKACVLTLLLLLFTLVGAVVAFVCFADPDKLKPAIALFLTRKTGYQVTIKGQLSWAVSYPILHITVTNVTFVQLEPSTRQLILAADRIIISANPLRWFSWQAYRQADIHVSGVHVPGKLIEQIDQLQIHSDWGQGRVILQPITAILYGGLLQGALHGTHLADDITHWDWQFSAKHLQLAKMPPGYPNWLKLFGTFDVLLHGDTKGKSFSAWLSNARNVAKFKLHHGTLLGIDLPYLAHVIRAAAGHRRIFAKQLLSANIEQTLFTEATGILLVEKGLYSIMELTLHGSHYSVLGNGRLFLAPFGVNFQVIVLPELVEHFNPTHFAQAIPLNIVGHDKQLVVSIDHLPLEQLVPQQKQLPLAVVSNKLS